MYPYMIYRKVTIHQGNIHDYLGVILDHSVKGQVSIFIVEYTKKILKDFSEEIWESTAMLAGDHIFQFMYNKDNSLFPKEQAIAFHHAITKLPFLIMGHPNCSYIHGHPAKSLQ